MLSTTVTVGWQLDVLPLASVTLSVTVFVPMFAQVKEFGLTLFVSVPLQLSLLPLSTSQAEIEACPFASSWTVMFLQLAIGGVLSTIVTVD
jgi:hypothetical protein